MNGIERTWSARRRFANGMALAALFTSIPLLYSGGLVTSFGVGMADPEWPTGMLRIWLAESFGLMIEHGHRLMAALVSILTLSLAITLWFVEDRPWVKRFGFLAFAFILIQATLGGMRVLLNARYGIELAAVHGVFAQCFFSTLVATTVFTSKRWLAESSIAREETGMLRISAVALTAIVFLQIVLGVALRHFGVAFWVHLALAMGLVFLVLWLAFAMLLHSELRAIFQRPILCLVGLIIVQIFLGFASMLLTELAPPGFGKTPTPLEAITTTAHLVTGSLILAVSLVLSIGVFRYLKPAPVAAATMLLAGQPIAEGAG